MIRRLGGLFALVIVVTVCGGAGCGKKPQPTGSADAPPGDKKDTGGKTPTVDVPLPVFDKSPPPVEFDFSKVDYTKGPKGETIRVSPTGTRYYDDPSAPNGTVQHGLEVVYYAPRGSEGLKDKASETYYFIGKKHGTQKTWFEDGKPKTVGAWYEGKPHGVYEAWHPNGKKAEACTYTFGQLQGYYISWHDNGNKKKEATYKDGKRQGPYVEWYSTGERMVQKTYVNDVEDGDAYGWFKSGQLQWRQTTKNGKLVGVETNWNKHGQVAYELDWGDGKTTPSVVRRYDWSSATKEELKDTIVGVSQANVVNPGKVFQATLKTKTFEQAFGKPDQESRTGDERLWTFRCRDGAITFRVVVLGAGVTQFKKIERE